MNIEPQPNPATEAETAEMLERGYVTTESFQRDCCAELLAALQKAVDYLGGSTTRNCDTDKVACDNAREALAKHQGAQP